MYRAYKEGRSETDPSENWYKGEIGFFDFYIIPLAKKLESCGVFGVSSDEYLAYAMRNREEWEKKGHEQVQQYLESYKELPPQIPREPAQMLVEKEETGGENNGAQSTLTHNLLLSYNKKLVRRPRFLTRQE